MIGYRISRKELEALLEEKVPGWLERAKTRTEEFRAKGRHEESSSIWSEVKHCYMELQGGCKCAYCERKMESVKYGKVEQDVEHFRPKANIGAWKTPKRLADLGIKITAVPSEKRGYHLLPYHVFNYAAACKPCNSALKRDYFPIAGAYDLQGEDPKTLWKEKPYLIYPIGDFDAAPEDLIRFHGISPQAVAATGHKRARALVTIEFFRLDDIERKNLLRERATVIVSMYSWLEKASDAATKTERAEARGIVDGWTSETQPHTNCARSFERLFTSDRAEAKAVFLRAVQFRKSIS